MANENYNKLLQDYVNAPYDVLLAVANDSLAKVMPVFNEIAEDGNGASIVLPFICTALAVDGKFSELEYKFIKDLLEIDQSYDYFKSVVQNYYSAGHFCICFCSCFRISFSFFAGALLFLQRMIKRRIQMWLL